MSAVSRCHGNCEALRFATSLRKFDELVGDAGYLLRSFTLRNFIEDVR